MNEPKLWKIIVGVTVGVLLAGAISYWVRLWLVNRAMAEMTQNIEKTTQQMRVDIARQVEVNQRRAELEKRERLEKKRQEVEALAARQRQEARLQMEAVQAAQANQEAREAAWNRFYVKPSRCENPQGSDFGECANEYIRAQRKFNKLYLEGKL